MPQPEPKNPFYFLLLLAGLAFTVTALAYAVVPTLEQRAADAGNRRAEAHDRRAEAHDRRADAAPLAATWRDALRQDGWKWLLAELALVILFSFLSMGLDRLRALQKERAAGTMPASDPQPSPESRER